jgi:hypothetical protein
VRLSSNYDKWQEVNTLSSLLLPWSMNSTDK